MREYSSEGKTPLGSFGEHLRREREMRGVSLDDIAETTKIGTRLLRALEDENFELLPGGIFNKGFVRAYAKYLGLNEEEAVADYLRAAGETAPDPRVIAEQNSFRGDRSGGEAKPSRQVGFPVIPVFILLVVIAAGAGGWQIYQERLRDRAAKSPSSTTTTTTSIGSGAKAPNTVANGNPPLPASTDSNAAGTKNGDSRAKSQVVPSMEVVKPGSPGVGVSNTGAADKGANQLFEVTVRARDSAWVAIKSDGKFAVRGIIRPPDVKTIHASDQIVVWTGNAGAVEVSFNGQPVPLLGGPNQEGVLVFNSHGAVSPKMTQASR